MTQMDRAGKLRQIKKFLNDLGSPFGLEGKVTATFVSGPDSEIVLSSVYPVEPFFLPEDDWIGFSGKERVRVQNRFSRTKALIE